MIPHPSNHDGSASSQPRDNPLKRPLHEEPSATATAAHKYTSGHSSCSKRHRPAEWPLKNDVRHEEPTAQAPRGRTKSPPSRRKSRAKKPAHSSKFKEGSLNDKPSKKPPLSYLGLEESMEGYVKSEGTNAPDAYDAGIDSSKSYGISRFGKAIANAFNPAIVWQGINSMWKEKEQPLAAARLSTDDRQDELFKVYADLKANGFKDIKTTVGPRQNHRHAPKITKNVAPSHHSSFRDSAIDMEETSSHRVSRESNARGSLEPSSLDTATHSPSHFSETNTARTSFTHIRTPSLQALKNVKSHLQLPSAKHRASAALSPRDSKLGELSTDHPSSSIHLSRQPSRIDIARVHKLNKRVSDLESKLEIARRELNQSLRDAPPIPDLPPYVGRKPFVPGDLPSLPSDRLLLEQIASADQSRSASMPAAPEDNLTQSAVNPSRSDQSSQAHSWLQIDSNDSTTKAYPGAVKAPTPNTKAARHQPAKPETTTISTQVEMKLRALPKLLPRPPPYAPTGHDMVPPIPDQMIVFHPSKIEQAKIIAMRAQSDPRLPFGESPEDHPNLRREYLTAAELQFASCIAHEDIQDQKHVTDYTSVQHANQPSSPFLGRPRSPSPTKARSAAPQKRDLSPPPPSLASARKAADGENIQTPAEGDSSPTLGRSGTGITPKLRMSKGDGMAGTAAKVIADKPLPDIQKEDFQWDEDVF